MNLLKNENAWDEFKSLLLSTKRKGVKEVINYLEQSDFTVAPASTRYHGDYEGGLLDHSLHVYHEAMRLKDLSKLFNLPDESVIIAALLHDICKVNFYKVEMRNVKENGTWVQKPYYTVDDPLPLGHGEKSVILLLALGLELTEVEISMIRGHMGGFVGDQYFNPSVLYNKYPECLIIHIADMIATYVVESPGLLEAFREKLEEYAPYLK